MISHQENSMKKMPPPEKIHEALSAIADDRVTMEENGASVVSSSGGKRYAVRWEGDVYSANDSATYWQLYPGYTIIAVLLLQGRLPLRCDIAALFSGIDWSELNRRHKRKYAKAVAEVMARLHREGHDPEAIERYIAQVYGALEALDITVKRGSLRPPK